MVPLFTNGVLLGRDNYDDPQTISLVSSNLMGNVERMIAIVAAASVDAFVSFKWDCSVWASGALFLAVYFLILFGLPFCATRWELWQLRNRQ
jgi:hypothetical protein